MTWEWTAPAPTKFLTINLADGTVCECRGGAAGGVVDERAESTVTPPSAAPSHAAEETPPRFTVFAPEEEPASIKVLLQTLCPERPESVQVAQTARQALDSRANVLVLFLRGGSASSWEIQKALPELQQEKIIGLGLGAARLFGDLGLEISADACAHSGVWPPPEIRVQPTNLLPGREKDVLIAFQMGESAERDSRYWDYNFRMHLPRLDEMTRFVEAIARSCDDENYAPMVRQGNYILVGLGTPPTTWTTDYRLLLTALAEEFARAPRVPFSTATWDPVRPGQYKFDLAPDFSTERLCDKTLYFRFTRPTRFSATLEHTGSRNVMMHFWCKNGTYAMREDAYHEETLRMMTDITQEDIDRAGTKYWSMHLANFDRMGSARCTLRIEY